MTVTVTQTGPIKRAIVRRLRSSGELKAALVGGIHQHLARGKVNYPYVVYTQVSAPFTRDWGTGNDQGTREIRALYDIVVFGANTVEAENLDQLIDTLFDGRDRELDPLVDGQRVTYCARVGSIPGDGPQEDDEGRYYAQVGGTYEIWTEQPIVYATMAHAGVATGTGAAIPTGP